MNITPYLLALDIAVGFWAVFMLVGVSAVLFAVIKVTKLLSKLEEKIDPLSVRSQHVLENVDQTVGDLRTKAESMLAVTEDTVRSVAAKVDTTTALVEGAVARPAIGLSSIMAGLNRGLETWRRYDAATSSPGLNGHGKYEKNSDRLQGSAAAAAGDTESIAP